MESTDSQDALVTQSVRTLLHEALDYTGLFPPAGLSLPQAIQNFSEHRSKPEGWMLSQFVLPVRSLPDLIPFRDLFRKSDPYDFSVLGTGGDTLESFMSAFDRDLDVIASFAANEGGRTPSARVRRMEVPLPHSLVDGSQDDLHSFLETLNRRLVTTGRAQLDLALQIPSRDAAIELLPPLCAAVAEHNSKQPVPPRTEICLKMRGSGREPSDVPSVEQMGALVATSQNAGVPFKVTAGLQHPLRHYDDGLDTNMHGFVNILGAAALAAEHQLHRSDVEAILREESSNNFRFLQDAFAWRNLTVSLEGIRYARNTLALSFGSSSIDEPIDHLRSLELL